MQGLVLFLTHISDHPALPPFDILENNRGGTVGDDTVSVLQSRGEITSREQKPWPPKYCNEICVWVTILHQLLLTAAYCGSSCQQNRKYLIKEASCCVWGELVVWLWNARIFHASPSWPAASDHTFTHFANWGVRAPVQVVRADSPVWCGNTCPLIEYYLLPVVLVYTGTH